MITGLKSNVEPLLTEEYVFEWNKNAFCYVYPSATVNPLCLRLIWHSQDDSVVSQNSAAHIFDVQIIIGELCKLLCELCPVRHVFI